jgi:hypothetical protein
LIQSFAVPERDRYQIVREHAPARMIIEDAGLGIVRTPNMLVLQVTTRPRSRAMKQAFCSSLVKKLETACGIAPSDVIVTFVTNTDEDWSFGLGRVQFLTGELSEEQFSSLISTSNWRNFARAYPTCRARTIQTLLET